VAHRSGDLRQCGSVSIRGIGRVLQITATTVISRIKCIAGSIPKPPIPVNRAVYEVDEMMTYIKRKQNRYCIVYALCSHTKQVVDFAVGLPIAIGSNKTTLRMW
jgi:insertion element IS1 protein InsB